MYYFAYLRRNLCKDLCKHGIRALRKTYKPVKVSVLFIGESPPDQQTSFYCGVGHLYDATKEAFKRVFDMKDYYFLDFFRGINCYLYDLFDEPGVIVDRVPRENQRRATDEEIEDAVRKLNKFIERERPEAVVFVLKIVYDVVCRVKRDLTGKTLEEYLRELGVKKIKALPFPRPEHRREYIDGLASFLRDLVEQGIIRIPPYRYKR